MVRFIVTGKPCECGHNYNNYNGVGSDDFAVWVDPSEAEIEEFVWDSDYQWGGM